MILIVGSNGNMASRYRAILDYLGQDFLCHDLDTFGSLEEKAEKSSHILIATPTETHLKLICDLSRYKAPILCEKPIVKNTVDLASLLMVCEKRNINLQMVNQYSWMPRRLNPESTLTKYDYYKHGSDTLAWDCINIVGLARSEIYLAEKSPIWECYLNGSRLNLADMDQSYIEMIKEWLSEKKNNIEYIEKAHLRVLEGKFS